MLVETTACQSWRVFIETQCIQASSHCGQGFSFYRAMHTHTYMPTYTPTHYTNRDSDHNILAAVLPESKWSFVNTHVRIAYQFDQKNQIWHGNTLHILGGPCFEGTPAPSKENVGPALPKDYWHPLYIHPYCISQGSVAIQFSWTQHAKISVVLVFDTSRPRNKVCSLRTVLPTEKMRSDVTRKFTLGRLKPLPFPSFPPLFPFPPLSSPPLLRSRAPKYS